MWDKLRRGKKFWGSKVNKTTISNINVGRGNVGRGVSEGGEERTGSWALGGPLVVGSKLELDGSGR